MAYSRTILRLANLLILLNFQVSHSQEDKTEVEIRFEEFSIVPELILKPPKNYAEVTYPNDLTIEMTELYDPNLLQEAPVVKWDANPTKYYVITMVDIDSPTAKFRTESAWKNWLIVNIPGNNTYMGQTLTEYQGPRPEPTTRHRYVILVYEQKKPCNFYDIFIDRNSIEYRSKFSPTAYAWKYKLDVYAGNFFICNYVSTTTTSYMPPTVPTETTELSELHKEPSNYEKMIKAIPPPPFK